MTDYADLEKRLRECAEPWSVLSNENGFAAGAMIEAADALASLTRELEDPLADLAHWLGELNTPHVILPDDCPEGERLAARTGFAYACDKIAEEITRRRDLSREVRGEDDV